jgi:membrane protease YdiL (CAAX protease family)
MASGSDRLHGVVAPGDAPSAEGDGPPPAAETSRQDPQSGGIPGPDKMSGGRLARSLQAVLEVLICSGFPTQITVAWLLALAGQVPFRPDGKLSATYVFSLSLADAVLLISLVIWFLRVHGERPRALLLGDRPIVREALLGLPLVVPVFLLVVVVLSAVRSVAPWLHNVPLNPLEGLIRTRMDAFVFGVVAIAGGGLREEIQRAFILRRFEQHLGGGWLGLALFSLVFGAGHTLQGWDVAIATAGLGALWGAVFLTRGSIAAPVVSHSLFNAAEILRYALYGL